MKVTIGNETCEIKFWKEHVLRECEMMEEGLVSYWAKITKETSINCDCVDYINVGDLLERLSYHGYTLSLRTNCRIRFNGTEFTASVVLNPKDKPSTFLARKYALQKTLRGFSMNKGERAAVWNTFLVSKDWK